MNANRWLIITWAAVVATAAPAWAQGRLDAETLKLYGGTYSSECGNAAAPRLRVVADALMVEQGNKRLTGGNVQAAYSFFGQSPPPNYQVALVSELRDKLQLLFIVYRDKSGQYITVDGDTKVQAAIGKALLGRKYYSCDSVRKESTPAPAAAAPQTDTAGDAGALIVDPKFKAAYYKALGPKVKEGWLADLDGPSPTNKQVKVGGTEYVMTSSCKNHDCGDNNTVLLYSPGLGVVYGKIYERGKTTLIGAPPPAVASELDRLWQAQWRQNR